VSLPYGLIPWHNGINQKATVVDYGFSSLHRLQGLERWCVYRPYRLCRVCSCSKRGVEVSRHAHQPHAVVTTPNLPLPTHTPQVSNGVIIIIIIIIIIIVVVIIIIIIITCCSLSRMSCISRKSVASNPNLPLPTLPSLA
jgi:hypothetical protein